MNNLKMPPIATDGLISIYDVQPSVISWIVETRGPVDARMTIDPSETDSFNGKPVVKMHD